MINANEETFRSEAIGIEFRYPRRLTTPPFAACRPEVRTDGLNLTVGPNVSVHIEKAGAGSLDTYSDFMRRIGAQVDRIESGLNHLRVEYRLQPAGRFGIATFVASGSSVYVIVFEARSPAACGESAPTEIYDLVIRTLRFLD